MNEYNLIGCKSIKTLKNSHPSALPSRFSSKITDHDRAKTAGATPAQLTL